jgi:hypothetical protein
MINGTGKQAIKNTASPVTISFAGLQSSRWSRGQRGKIDISAPKWGLAETER